MERPIDQDRLLPNLPPTTADKVAEFQQELDQAFDYPERLLVEEALWLMCEVHDGQARPDGAPYAEHPLAVARLTLSAAAEPDSELVAAALLHDTVEDQAARLAAKCDEPEAAALDDTGKALAYIAAHFGERTARVVAAVTNPDFAAQLVAEGLPVTAENKNRLYAEHVRAAIEDADVLSVKLGDFGDNGLRIHELTDPVKRLKLTRKYAPVAAAFIERLESDQPTHLHELARVRFLDLLEQARVRMQEALSA